LPKKERKKKGNGDITLKVQEVKNKEGGGGIKGDAKVSNTFI
jgi:hypothetical protein